MSGQVLEVIPGTNDLQIYTDAQENSAVIVLKPSMKAVPAGSFVVVSGVSDGNFVGKNGLGATVTYPQYAARYIRTTDFVGYFAAGGKVFHTNVVWSGGGVTARLKEVIVSPTKGTVFVLVIANSGSSSIDVYAGQATVVARSSHKEVQAVTDMLAPDAITTIAPGAVVTELAEFAFYPKGGTYAVDVPAFGGNIPANGLQFTVKLPKPTKARAR